MPDRLPAELDAGLRLTTATRGQFGARVLYFNDAGSTNDLAARAADAGASEGTIVIAGAQTAGRGRLGRVWHSPAGAGLYVSVVLTDTCLARWLTLAAGVSVAEGITRATGLPVQLKWPNDVVVVGSRTFRERRKLAGILAEASSGPQGVQTMILGFGINLRAGSFPPELADRATSIETELGRAVDAGSVLGAVLSDMCTRFDDIRSGNSRAVLEHWARLSPSAFGASIEWDVAGGVRSGTSAGLAPDGSLLVRAGATIDAIRSGEVRWT